MVVDNKVNGKITDSPKKKDGKTDTRQMNNVAQTFACAMAK